MKITRTKSAATLAAFLSLAPMANALAAGQIFTAYEDLLPEQRREVAAVVDELTKDVNVDWSNIAIGVDENGQIVVVPKGEANLQAVGAPSSFGIGAVRKADRE